MYPFRVTNNNQVVVIKCLLFRVDVSGRDQRQHPGTGRRIVLRWIIRMWDRDMDWIALV
jgi:hypothetical protein